MKGYIMRMLTYGTGGYASEERIIMGSLIIGPDENAGALIETLNRVGMWGTISDPLQVSEKYVRNDRTKERGVIIENYKMTGNMEYAVVNCNTGAVEFWHYQDIRWLYLVPKEDW